MHKVIDMFSRRAIIDDMDFEINDNHLALENMPGDGDPLEIAASDVCSAAAKLAIECDLETFEAYLAELKLAINNYQALKTGDQRKRYLISSNGNNGWVFADCPDITRLGDILQAPENLIAELGNIQKEARELNTKLCPELKKKVGIAAN
ncbi:MAG: hypothetical protein JRF40_00490 [Deltaproteobacteria bacterium]|nr:hypothetical protein [Deltaproteobacteria bacterium]